MAFGSDIFLCIFELHGTRTHPLRIGYLVAGGLTKFKGKGCNSKIHISSVIIHVYIIVVSLPLARRHTELSNNES
jgi:hypothetical protein